MMAGETEDLRNPVEKTVQFVLHGSAVKQFCVQIREARKKHRDV